MACDQIIDSYDGSKDGIESLVFVGDYSGQAFTMGVTPRDICGAKLYIEAVYAGGNSIDVAARIYACTGTPGTDGVPTGAALATSDSIQYTGDVAAAWTEFTFSTPYTLLANTDYCIILECVAVDDYILHIDVSLDYTSPSHSGNYCYYSAGSGGYEAGFDLNFFIYYSVGWSGKFCSVSSLGKINSIEVANIGKVIGV
jgi:hypothetical protein